jgi:hypothetical protein
VIWEWPKIKDRLAKPEELTAAAKATYDQVYIVIQRPIVRIILAEQQKTLILGPLNFEFLPFKKWKFDAYRCHDPNYSRWVWAITLGAIQIARHVPSSKSPHLI